MFGSAILEVAIGIIFIYILVAIICAAIREGIEGWLKTRAAYLEQGIRELLNDQKAPEGGLARNFFDHPLIYSLFSSTYSPGKSEGAPKMMANGRGLPSYIPSRNFALALMDLAARGPVTDTASSDSGAPIVSLDGIRANISSLGNTKVQRALLTALDAAEGDFNRAVANVEAWYDSSMDRVSGWYKRSTQWILFWIALIFTMLMNINTVAIADYLYKDDVARASVVAAAERLNAGGKLPNREEAERQLDALNLPIGWEGYKRVPLAELDEFWNDWLGPVLGWLMTAFAAMLGAPFWFDVLNKVMVIRSTVKPHEKSPEEGSEDRQMPSKMLAVLGAQRAGGRQTPVAFDTELDGCGYAGEAPTTDDQLPGATGGVK